MSTATSTASVAEVDSRRLAPDSAPNRADAAASRPPSPFIRAQIRAVTAAIILLLRAARRLAPRRRAIPASGADVLLTGTFHSDNWLRSHVKPLADSKNCARVRIVATNPVPLIEKVEPIYPPAWLIRIAGSLPARLIVFGWVAARTRPHIVGAFHLLFNGLFAALLARCVGARSLYFCVGGPAEVLHGGQWSENRFFQRLQSADPLVERWLIEAIGGNDLIITMGSRAAHFFRQRGVEAPIHIVPGGIDPERFEGPAGAVDYDVILVGRLARIKRIDLFIRAIGELARVRPNVTAVIVGDGALRSELSALVGQLGLGERITFAGRQSDVAGWLRRSKVFMLTSESEGLALSLMEAMMCGLPAVVPNVGDLGDLVVDGVNGFLVDDREPGAFSARLDVLLGDPTTYAAFAASARASARRFETAATVRLWDDVLRVDRPSASGACV